MCTQLGEDPASSSASRRCSSASSLSDHLDRPGGPLALVARKVRFAGGNLATQLPCAALATATVSAIRRLLEDLNDRRTGSTVS